MDITYSRMLRSANAKVMNHKSSIPSKRLRPTLDSLEILAITNVMMLYQEVEELFQVGMEGVDVPVGGDE